VLEVAEVDGWTVDTDVDLPPETTVDQCRVYVVDPLAEIVAALHDEGIDPRRPECRGLRVIGGRQTHRPRPALEILARASDEVLRGLRGARVADRGGQSALRPCSRFHHQHDTACGVSHIGSRGPPSRDAIAAHLRSSSAR